MTLLATERLLIRPWRPGPHDRDALSRMATDAEMMQFVTGGKAWSNERIDQFLLRQEAFTKQHGLAFAAVELRATAEVIGLCGIQPLDSGEFELGWWIWKAHWGCGYATEAAVVVMAHARDVLGLDRLFAVIDPPNAASIRVAEKLGLRFERHMPACDTRAERDDKTIALYGIRFGDIEGTGDRST